MNRCHPDFHGTDTDFDIEPVGEWGESLALSTGTGPFLILSGQRGWTTPWKSDTHNRIY
jgi:hypothetical protein